MTSPIRTIGPYELRERLGAGGMGEVWSAWDPRLSRRVAIKLLKSIDADDLERFRREATLAASLAHPNIGAIHEFGEEAGRPYIAMQHIEGRTLRGWRGSPRDAVALIREAARGVEWAHAQGVIHRDLKPENLMLDRAGRVYVMDFGLARPVEAGTGKSLTLSGMAVGTPSYMSPEQARGGSATPRSDAWGLGATLYELIAGVPPFTGATVFDILAHVIDDDPPRLRGAPREIEAVVMKCLDKDPARRYADARELGDDLDRLLRGDAVSARTTGLGGRLLRRIRRRPALSALAAALVLLGAGFAAFAVVSSRRVAGLELSSRSKDALLAAERALAEFEREQFLPVHPLDPALTRLREAAGHLREAASLQPGASALWARLAEVLRRLRRYDEADAAITEAVAREPDLGDHWLTAVLLSDDRETEANIRALGAATSAARERARKIQEEQRRRGHELLDRASAARRWTSAEAAAYVNFLVALTRGDDAAAEAFVAALRSSDPRRIESTVALAFELASRRHIDRGLRHAEDAVAAARSSVEAHHVRGSLRCRRGELRAKAGSDEALADWQVALESAEAIALLEPDAWQRWDIDANTRFQRSMFLAQRGLAKPADFDPALDSCTRWLERCPDPAQARKLRGELRLTKAVLLLRAGQDDGPLLDEAERDFLAALELDPEFAHARSRLGEVFDNRAMRAAERGDDPLPLLDQARDAFARAVRLAPDDAAILATFGVHLKNAAALRRHRGADPTADYDAGEEVLGRALRADPDRLETLLHRSGLRSNRAIFLLLTKGDPGSWFDAAIDDARELVRRESRDPRCWQALGLPLNHRARHLQGKGSDPMAAYREAQEAFDKALEIAPEDPELLAARGDVRANRASWLAGLPDAREEPVMTEIRAAYRDYNEAIRIRPGMRGRIKAYETIRRLVE